jgi:hypothetical protein
MVFQKSFNRVLKAIFSRETEETNLKLVSIPNQTTAGKAASQGINRRCSHHTPTSNSTRTFSISLFLSQFMARHTSTRVLYNIAHLYVTPAACGARCHVPSSTPNLHIPQHFEFFKLNPTMEHKPCYHILYNSEVTFFTSMPFYRQLCSVMAPKGS